MRYSLEFELGKGLLLCFVVATVAVLSFAAVHVGDDMKAREWKKNVILYLIRWIHYFTFFAGSFYIFIFTSAYDLWYVVYFVLLALHWKLFKNECILSYWEKKILRPDYKMGETPKEHPFMDMIFPGWVIKLVTNMLFFMFGFIVLRLFITYSLKFRG